MNQPADPRKRVVIIGGGLAGLSAAEALARDHGSRFQITLLEGRRITGGRAGSFTESGTGETVDYCQHVAMGCCTNLIELLRRCGLSDSMQRYSQLQFFHPQHRPSRFAPSQVLPPPLHLARTLSALEYLSYQQRRQIRRGLWRLFRCRSDSLNNQLAADWLHSNGQSDATIRDFWSVIAVSALGEQIDRVSAPALRKVFVDGFAAARGASDVLVPKLPLSELFGQRLPAALEKLGVEVLTGKSAKRLVQSGKSAVAVTRDGAEYQACHVIVAVPWHAVGDLISADQIPSVDQFNKIPASPITGIHLWFDRQITELPHAVMVGTVSQWLFRQPWKDSEVDSHFYYQVVISASQQTRLLPHRELLQAVLAELRHAFPAAVDARLLRSRLVTDPNSVFSIRPEVEAIRPVARTPLPWLHLAGDWIATGWPATMEGAVIGGRLAASSLVQQEGLDGVSVDPGLRRSWLARQIIRP